MDSLSTIHKISGKWGIIMRRRGRNHFSRCIIRYSCDRRWLDRICINMKKAFDEVYCILNSQPHR